jgi:hypothetical protein
VGQLLYGLRMQYPADALSVPYGTACGTGAIAAPRPFAGHGLFTISLTGRPAGTSCVLMLGTGPGAVPLDVFQMPGCFLNLDPAQIVVSIPTAVVGTAASITLPLFDDPLFVGDLFAQWAFVQPGLNAANLGTTRGLRIQVR